MFSKIYAEVIFCLLKIHLDKIAMLQLVPKALDPSTIVSMQDMFQITAEIVWTQMQKN